MKKHLFLSAMICLATLLFSGVAANPPLDVGITKVAKFNIEKNVSASLDQTSQAIRFSTAPEYLMIVTTDQSPDFAVSAPMYCQSAESITDNKRSEKIYLDNWRQESYHSTLLAGIKKDQLYILNCSVRQCLSGLLRPQENNLA